MNTSQLTYIMKNSPVTSKAFVGVFAADQLPSVARLQLPAAYIINTEPGGASGEHWLGIFQETMDTMEFFDSFGRPLTEFHRNSQDFCAGYSILSQNQKLQSPLSTACGQFVSYFIWKRCSGLSFNQVMAKFYVDPHDNDEMVVLKVNNVFDCKTEVYDKAMLEQCVRRIVNDF